MLLTVMLAFSLAAPLHALEASASPITLVSTQVPVLSNAVTVDGKQSSLNEWSDASKFTLTMLCGDGLLPGVLCEPVGMKSPAATLDTDIWVKHDYTWLYFLYQIPQIAYQYRYGPEVWATYCFSVNGKQPWATCDLGWWTLNLTDRSHWGGDDWYIIGGKGGSDVTKFGGQKNIIGAATFDKNYYWFEFKKMLNSGDGFDWVMVPGKTYGVWDIDGVINLSFGDSDRPRWGGYVSLSLCPCTGTTGVTTSTITTSYSLTQVSTETQYCPCGTGPDCLSCLTFSTSNKVTAEPFYAQMAPYSIGILATAFLLVGVASTFLVMKRRKHAAIATTETVERVQPTTRPVQLPKPYVSTGYEDLDGSLEGGIPHGYAVVLVSPSYDERDLLLRRTIDSSLSSGMPVYYVSNDMAKTQDLILRCPSGFYAFCSHADKIPSHGANLFKIPGIENLSDANLSLTLALKEARAKETATKSLLILDILSDVLLRHKALVARRWVNDFVGKRKTEGFTILATLNPLIGTKEETQAVIDFFDGIMEIYEKSLLERARRFLIVKKMFGRRYAQAEIMLDIERLW